MCDFSGKNFDADKTVQYSKLQNEMAKKYKSFSPNKTSTNQDLIQQMKDLRGK